MSAKPHVRLGAQYRNPDVRSSGKVGLKWAAHVARQLGMVRTWSNLQTIRLAIESEAELSDIAVAEAAEVILRAAREHSQQSIYRPPSDWEVRQIFRENSVDRFWFEDSRWRAKYTYM